MPGPLFQMRGVRVDVGGAAAVDGLSCEASGEHVIVVGAARALFEATSGTRPVAHGELLIEGVPADLALRRGIVAGAPLDPPMPPKWTPRMYATWSARLAGHPRKAAVAMAEAAVVRLHLSAMADVALARAPISARRATVIGAAMATGARVLVLEDPLAALDDPLSRTLAKIVTGALEDRGWIVFAPRMPLASPLALHADEALVVTASEVTAQGQPAEIAARERAFSVRVHGQPAAFARLVTARGGRVGGVSMGVASDRLATQMTVDLEGDLTTRDLMALAEEANSVIVELSPLSRAFQ